MRPFSKFFGGPYDGLPVLQSLAAAYLMYGACEGGEYVWDGARYRWVQG